jgi:hypothetical protein
MLLYEGDAPQKGRGVQVRTLEFFPPSQSNFGFMSIPSPARYVIRGPVTQGIKIEQVGAGMTLLTGQLPPGRYCARLLHEPGVADWFFLFEVSAAGKNVQK